MRTRIVVLLVCLLMLGQSTAQEDRLQVAASTSIIADVARNVGGDLVNVTSIIPIGADVHTFNPSPRDLTSITEADVVFVNGMRLEEGLLDLIEENAPVEPVVVSMGVNVLSGEAHSHDDDEAHDDEAHDDHDHEEAEYLGVLGEDAECGDEHDEHDGEEAHEGDEEHHDDEDHDDHDHGPCDPHVWTNPANVMMWAENIAAAYAQADPDNTETYIANAEAYIAELEALNDELTAMIEAVPEENRVLVTNHDFLSYFAATYDFEIVGTVIPAATTAAEVTPRSLEALIDVIEDEGVSAIFAETSDSTALAETIAGEVGGEFQVVQLYSGSLGDDDVTNTYIGYMRANVEAITTALG